MTSGQQDRWSDGGAHGLVTAVTHNGGASWTSTFPHFSTCAGGTAQNGGNYDRASDPWVSFGSDGTAYQVSLSFNATNNVNAVLASRSIDGGDHWSEPWTIIRDSGERDVAYAFNDKESVTADALTPGYAYAAWDRFVSPSGTARASIEGLIHSPSFREPIWFSRTTNRGATWEPARNIGEEHLRPERVQRHDREPDRRGEERRSARLLRRVPDSQERGPVAW